MMDVFSRAPAPAHAALRRGDPQAMAGTSGDNRTAMAQNRDWSVRGRALDVVGRYFNSTAMELKALGALGAKSLWWTGYDDPDPIIRHRVWTALGLGDDAMGLFAETTLVNPDLSLPEVGRDLAAALLPIRRGVGGLFAASQPFDDGVFVLVSADSSAVLAIHGYETLGVWLSGAPPAQPDLGNDAREGAHELLAAMGIGWRAIFPADLENGLLEGSGAKVLILPMCAALSDASCEALERWVGHGGNLIADLLPGTFTAHGRLRGTGIAANGSLQASASFPYLLDRVFGVTPGARPPISSDTVTLSTGPQFPVRCLDSALVATTGRPGGTGAGSAPIWFQNAFGLGHAAYLACAVFADYLSAGRPARLQMEETFTTLLQSFGVVPHAQVVNSTGGRVELCQFRVRSAGSAELVVLLRNYLGISSPVALETDGELRFSTDAYTYDLDNGDYLGYGRRLALRIGNYTYRAFARLPYRVESLTVTVGAGSRLGDTLAVDASLTVAGGPASWHRFRLDVVDSSGRSLRYLAQERAAEGGIATFIVPTAFNDPPGMWTIIVTDITTGIKGTTSLDLGPRASFVAAPEPFQVDAIDD